MMLGRIVLRNLSGIRGPRQQKPTGRLQRRSSLLSRSLGSKTYNFSFVIPNERPRVVIADAGVFAEPEQFVDLADLVSTDYVSRLSKRGRKSATKPASRRLPSDVARGNAALLRKQVDAAIRDFESSYKSQRLPKARVMQLAQSTFSSLRSGVHLQADSIIILLEACAKLLNILKAIENDVAEGGKSFSTDDGFPIADLVVLSEHLNQRRADIWNIVQDSFQPFKEMGMCFSLATLDESQRIVELVLGIGSELNQFNQVVKLMAELKQAQKNRKRAAGSDKVEYARIAPTAEMRMRVLIKLLRAGPPYSFVPSNKNPGGSPSNKGTRNFLDNLPELTAVTSTLLTELSGSLPRVSSKRLIQIFRFAVIRSTPQQEAKAKSSPLSSLFTAEQALACIVFLHKDLSRTIPPLVYEVLISLFARAGDLVGALDFLAYLIKQTPPEQLGHAELAVFVQAARSAFECGYFEFVEKAAANLEKYSEQHPHLVSEMRGILYMSKMQRASSVSDLTVIAESFLQSPIKELDHNVVNLLLTRLVLAAKDGDASPLLIARRVMNKLFPEEALQTRLEPEFIIAHRFQLDVLLNDWDSATKHLQLVIDRKADELNSAWAHFNETKADPNRAKTPSTSSLAPIERIVRRIKAYRAPTTEPQPASLIGGGKSHYFVLTMNLAEHQSEHVVVESILENALSKIQPTRHAMEVFMDANEGKVGVKIVNHLKSINAFMRDLISGALLGMHNKKKTSDSNSGIKEAKISSLRAKMLQLGIWLDGDVLKALSSK